jgi:DNA-binding CsgD family transcriptional regulator
MACYFAFVLLFCSSGTLARYIRVSERVSRLLLLGLIAAAFVGIAALAATRQRHLFLTTDISGSNLQRLRVVSLVGGLLVSLGCLALFIPSLLLATGLSSLGIAFGATALMVTWGHSTALVKLRPRVVVSGFATIAGSLLYLLIISLPEQLAALMAGILPSVSGVLGFVYWRHLSEPPTFTSGETDIPFYNMVDRRILLYAVSFGCFFSLIGYALLQVEPNYAAGWVPGVLCISLFLLAQIALAFYMVRVIKVESPQASYRPVPLLFAAGFLLLPFVDPPISWLAMAVAFAGFGCFGVFYWVILSNTAYRFRSSPEIIYSLGFLLLTLGAIIGELIKLSLGILGQTGHDFSVSVAVIGLTLLVIVLWQNSDGALFANETVEMGGSFTLTQKVLKTDNALRAQAIASHFSLSPREVEVLELLMEGRNVPAISAELVLSKNTVQTHVKSIYRKTGVSKRQHLLTLADELATLP